MLWLNVCMYFVRLKMFDLACSFSTKVENIVEKEQPKTIPNLEVTRSYCFFSSIVKLIS